MGGRAGQAVSARWVRVVLAHTANVAPAASLRARVTRRRTHGGARIGAGRRPVTETVRTARFTIRLTPAELAAMRTAAEQAGLSLADWVRGRLEEK